MPRSSIDPELFAKALQGEATSMVQSRRPPQKPALKREPAASSRPHLDTGRIRDALRQHGDTNQQRMGLGLRPAG